MSKNFLCLPASLSVIESITAFDSQNLDSSTNSQQLEPYLSFNWEELWQLISQLLHLAPQNELKVNQQSGLLAIHRILALQEQLVRIREELYPQEDSDHNITDREIIKPEQVKDFNAEVISTWKKLKATKFNLYLLDSKKAYQVFNKEADTYQSKISEFACYSNLTKINKQGDYIPSQFTLIQYQDLPQPHFGIISKALRCIGKLSSSISDIGKNVLNQLLLKTFTLQLNQEQAKKIFITLVERREFSNIDKQKLSAEKINFSELAEILTTLSSEYLYQSAMIFLKHNSPLSSVFGISISSRLRFNFYSETEPYSVNSQPTINKPQELDQESDYKYQQLFYGTNYFNQVATLADNLYSEEEFSSQYWLQLGQQCRILHKLGISLAQISPQLVVFQAKQNLNHSLVESREKEQYWLGLNSNFNQRGIRLNSLPTALKQQLATLNLFNQPLITQEQEKLTDNSLMHHYSKIIKYQSLLTKYLDSDYVEPWQIQELEKFRGEINKFNSNVHGFFSLKAWQTFLDGYEKGINLKNH